MRQLLVILLFVIIRINALSMKQPKGVLQQSPPYLRLPDYERAPQSPCANMVIKKVASKFYVLDTPRNITGIPADISIHWRTGRVFFTLISDQMKMRLAVMDLNGVSTINVPGTGQSTAVDNRNNIVYLASDNGVYKYDNDGTVTPYTATGEDVMYLAVSNDGATMLIATWPQNRVHMITKNGQRQETFSLIPNGHDLTVDTRNNIYFVAAKTSYVLREGHTIPMKIKGLPTDKVTSVFVSRSENVYGMDETGNLYLIDPDNANAAFIGAFDVQNVNTFGMDAYDNVIIGVKGALLKYNRMDTAPCSEYVA